MLFPCTIFAQDEYVRIRAGDLLNGLEHVSHGWRRSNKRSLTVIEILVLCLLPDLGFTILASCQRLLEGVDYCSHKFVFVPRLRQKIYRSFLDGSNSKIDVAIGSLQHNLC